MKLRSFLKTIGLLPAAAIIPTKIKAEEAPPVQVFKYQSCRGRPWLLFVINNKYKLWYYWAFEKEWELPPEGKWEGANCFGCPRDEGWIRFEGHNPEIELCPPRPIVEKNFPTYEQQLAYCHRYESQLAYNNSLTTLNHTV